MTIDYKANILLELRLDALKWTSAHGGPARKNEWICARLGIERGRGGRYSKTAYRRYELVGRALQALKRDGKVVYLTRAEGGPGWRLA